MDIWQEVLDIEDYLISMRRKFHEKPELSWEEFETADAIENELDKFGIKYKRVFETGVIADLPGKNNNITIGIRADIDALPIDEDTGLSYASKNKGIMHACGHDAHIAMLLGTANVLSKYKDELPFNIKLIFQPAEEYIMDSGAKYLVEVDEIKELDNIIGAHIWSSLDSGKISVREGAVMASADTFKIKVMGKGGHGAQPQETIDPIIISTNIVNNLQTLASREINPMNPLVISICSIKGGDSPNIIPNEVVLEGTVRTFDNILRNKIPEKIERIISNTCNVFRGNYNFEYYYGTPATVNESNSVGIAKKAVFDILGEQGLASIEPTTGGEDFAKYLEVIPGCYIFIGGKIENNDYPHHNSKFNIDESALKNGVAFFLSYIKNYKL